MVAKHQAGKSNTKSFIFLFSPSIFLFLFFFATGSLVRDGRNFYPIKLLFRSLEVRSTKYLLLCNCKNRHKFTFVEFNSDIYTIALFFFFFGWEYLQKSKCIYESSFHYKLFFFFFFFSKSSFQFTSCSFK